MNVNQVKALNDKIENINLQRTKAETKKEFLMSRLKSSLAEYEKAYGVKLNVGSLKDVIKAINEEKSKVVNSIKEEYDLKEKVVQAIESGNIDEANKLLGVTSDNSSKVEDEEEFDGSAEIEVSENLVKDIKSVQQKENNSNIEVYDDEEAQGYILPRKENKHNTSSNGLDMSGLSGFTFSTDNFDDENSSDSNDEDDNTVYDDEVVLDKDEDYDDIGDLSDDDFGFGEMLKGSKLDI